MARVVVYVPGLGDKAWRQVGQSALLSIWRPLYGIRMRYFAARWSNPREGFPAKLQRLLKMIDGELAKGNTVSVIGASAGASMALHALLARPKVVSAISVCGKLRNPQTISELVYTVNPAFKPSIERLVAAEPTLTSKQRAKILLVRPQRDAVVPVGENWVRGATVTTLPTFGHAFSILASLTFFSRRLAVFIRKAQASHNSK